MDNKTTVKIIINCVIAALLVISMAFNIFIISVLGITDVESFKQAILANEPLDNTSSSEVDKEVNNVKDVESNKEETSKEDDKDSGSDRSELTEETNTPEDNKPIKDILYQDENVTITFHSFEDSILGPTYKYVIENTSDRNITISFSDVYVDGYSMALSGLYCYNLLPNTKAIEDFTMFTNEWEEFTDYPTEVKFNIQLINPDTYLTFFESERITIKI